ncbi:Hint domain-containing protein [Ruegeria atlantica]|uniref:Hint domain-containing protein n=1 Tax=Ruegeria atlantica TaxID=81569 RepID=UPI00147E3ED0
MANYSYIGYSPDVISVTVFGFGTVTLSPTYDPSTDRRVFNVEDEPGPPPLINGDPDNGTDFNGDRFNNEIGDDLTQQGLVTDLDGNPISGLTENGNIYLEESYALADPDGGTITVYRVEVDGVLAGYITSEPLVPGVAYDSTPSNVTPDNAPDTTDPDAIVDVPCFVQGTLIGTPSGEKAVEMLEVGDLVLTAEGQAKEIKWIGSRSVDVSRADKCYLKPVRIAKGALGQGLPASDLFVSPNHRILVSAAGLELLFEDADVLVPAKFLLDLPGVEVVSDSCRVVYYHFIFDKHEIVVSNGAYTESLFPGDIALKGMAHEAQLELAEIFPDIFESLPWGYGPTAAKVLRKHEAAMVISQYMR